MNDGWKNRIVAKRSSILLRIDLMFVSSVRGRVLENEEDVFESKEALRDGRLIQELGLDFCCHSDD